MYSQDDINSAVAAGAISAESAAALRTYVSQRHDMPMTDEENFRLVSSFNDIFVAIGVIIMLLAAGAIGQALGGLIFALPPFPIATGNNDPRWIEFALKSRQNSGISMVIGGALVAATAWLLAEFFTRRRRMALPSILLLLTFVGGVFAAAMGLGMLMDALRNETVGALFIAGAGLLAGGAAWFHWRRFMVPITVAAGAGAISVTIVALIVALLDGILDIDMTKTLLVLVLLVGLAVFALAMRWDMSDRERTTRRSDVAFWLHLLAAPMIAHPVFYALGVMEGDAALGVGSAVGVLAIYVVFGLVALAIDRRALLVSALAYVLAALAFLFDRFGAVELTFALTALVIGSALLTLAGFWTPIRNRVVASLPGTLQQRVPVIGPVAA